MARQLRLRYTCLLAVLLCSGTTALYAQDAAWLAERQQRYKDWLSGGQGTRKPAESAEDPQQAAAARIRNAAEGARRTSATLSKEQLGAALQLFKSAAGLHANKEYDAAKLGLERALGIDPGNALGQFLLGDTLERLKDTNGARERYQLTLALAPNSTEGLRAEAALAKLPTSQSAATVIPGGGDAPTKRADIWDCAECPELMTIPAGSFTMGSPDSEPGRFSLEGPQHQVNIPNSFAVG